MINRPEKQFVFINSASIKCIFKAVVYQLEFIVVQVNSAFVIIVFFWNHNARITTSSSVSESKFL